MTFGVSKVEVLKCVLKATSGQSMTRGRTVRQSTIRIFRTSRPISYFFEKCTSNTLLLYSTLIQLKISDKKVSDGFLCIKPLILSLAGMICCVLFVSLLHNFEARDGAMTSWIS